MQLNLFKLTIFINISSGISCTNNCKQFLLHPDFLDDKKQPLLTKLFSGSSSCFDGHEELHHNTVEKNLDNLENYFKDFNWIGPFEVPSNNGNENFANRIGLFFKAIMIPPTAIYEHKNDLSKIFNDDLCSLNGYFPSGYGHSKETIDKPYLSSSRDYR